MPKKLNRKRKYNNKKRARKHGFRKRMQSKSWKKVLARRRKKGRTHIAVKTKKK